MNGTDQQFYSDGINNTNNSYPNVIDVIENKLMPFIENNREFCMIILLIIYII